MNQEQAWQVRRFNNRLERVRLQAKAKEAGVFTVAGFKEFSRTRPLDNAPSYFGREQYVADVMSSVMKAIQEGCTHIEIEKEAEEV